MGWRWRQRGRAVTLLLGLLTGALVGFGVYGVAHLHGVALFILAGAVGGIAAAIITQFYTNSVSLTDITITVPQFSELHFAVTRDSQQVAWKSLDHRRSRQSGNTGDTRLRLRSDVN